MNIDKIFKSIAYLVLVLLSIVHSVFSCSIIGDIVYDDDWIIGKTPEEIQEKYGDFDCVEIVDGEYSYGAYKLRGKIVIGETIHPSIYYRITFDEDSGVAEYTKNGCVISGWKDTNKGTE